MAVHMSVRLAWHSDGWNGHICKKPCENVYCVGQHSYPGDGAEISPLPGQPETK